MVLVSLLSFVVGCAVGWYGRKFYRDEVNQVVDKVKEKVDPPLGL